MKSFINGLVLAVSVAIMPIASAATPTDIFGGCLVDNLNGKERKVLAKWIFFAIAAHPEISSYSNATDDDIRETDKSIGELITRLLVDDCRSEMQAANKVDPQAIGKAFELVGQVAMQEIMTNQAVTTTISNYINYADQEKISSILGE